MEPTPVTRRLAAVLIADVAGYSRLMERDETGTHVRIRSLLSDAVEPAIVRHHGRLLRTMGDGVLADFPSATDAVRCAVELQRTCAERNRKFPDADPVELRIGINVADVMFDQSDIAGGGVNLAARLETLASPGGICISQALREQIHEDLGLIYLNAGTRRVKNISKPVRVIRVLTEPPTALDRIKLVLGRLPLQTLAIVGIFAVAVVIGAAFVLHKTEVAEPETLSLQVGEFKPSSADDAIGAQIAKSLAQQVYLALSPERNMLQIKATPTGEPSQLMGKPLSRYVVEGIVTPVAGGYRVDARLMESRDRTALWGDVFLLKDPSSDTVGAGANRVAHALHGEVFKLEVKRTKQSPPSKPTAMDLVLMGYGHYFDGEGGLDKARRLFEQALALDPRNVPALLALAFLSPASEQDRLTQDAVANDPLCADSWAMRGRVLARLGQARAAREAIERALRINPVNGTAQIERDELLMNEGQWTQVIRRVEDVEFEFAKSQLIKAKLRIQCIARLLAEQDAEEACNRWFATAGSEASLVYATAAVVRKSAAHEAQEAAARLKARHPGYTIAADRRRLADSKDFSQQYLAQLDRVVFAALVSAGVPE